MASINEIRIPHATSDTPLAELRGSKKQTDWAYHFCRPNLLGRVAARNPPLAYALRTVTDATWFIANKDRAYEHIRWPDEWMTEEAKALRVMQAKASRVEAVFVSKFSPVGVGEGTRYDDDQFDDLGAPSAEFDPVPPSSPSRPRFSSVELATLAVDKLFARLIELDPENCLTYRQIANKWD